MAQCRLGWHLQSQDVNFNDRLHVENSASNCPIHAVSRNGVPIRDGANLKLASAAFGEAIEALAAIEGEKPLLKFIESDEDGETEMVGDFLHRQPNIVTDARPLDFFPLRSPTGWFTWWTQTLLG